MTASRRPLRIVIADDELRVRRGLAMRLGLEPDLEVVGQAADASDAVAVATLTAPDVVVLDVRMPRGGGLPAIPRLRRAAPEARIVVLSLHDDRATRDQACATGADVFVAKSDGDAALLHALRQVTGDTATTTDGGSTIMLDDDALAITPVLTGERLQLRPLGPEHLEPFWASVNDPELRRVTGTTATFTRDGVRAWLEARSEADDRLDLAIHLRGDGAYIGELALLDVDTASASADVRIALDRPEHRGHGHGPEALALLLDHAFDTVGLHRVGLDVFAFNTGAIRAYERLGFRHEGRRREVLHQDGQWHDALLMGLLREEWRGAAGRGPGLTAPTDCL